LTWDGKFLEIMRPAGIRGTFNLCSHSMNRMTPAEYRAFYEGYEIANHCRFHPAAFIDGETYTISDEPFDEAAADPAKLYRTETEGLYRIRRPKGWRMIADGESYCRFIDDCHEYLTEVFGEGSIRCFVWPYHRQNNSTVEAYLPGLPGYYGVRVSGAREGTDGFAMPEDRWQWHYTATHLTLSGTSEKYAALPDDGTLKFFCVGVHSIDYEREAKWDELRDFAARFGNNPDYYSAPAGELFDYEDAVNQLVITDTAVTNPSKIDLYIRADGENVILKAGETLRF